ncbi:hypothetical protein HU200_002284 [Digitaria exilis]|uniref:Uncharacterized protein n=1 Tax=Digitaria exilis TaxID=1010633 RepID=A0A835KV81_9POAL|nr:hypothetical protein HU200_002284 [Digitaria exilis]
MRTRGDHPSHRVLRVPRSNFDGLVDLFKAEVFVYNTERLVNDLTRTSKFAEEKLEVIDERFDQIIKEFISKVKDIISSIDIQEEYLAETPKTMREQISDVMVHSKPRRPPFTSCVECSKAEAFTYNTERLVNDLTRTSKFAEEKLEVDGSPRDLGADHLRPFLLPEPWCFSYDGRRGAAAADPFVLTPVFTACALAAAAAVVDAGFLRHAAALHAFAVPLVGRVAREFFDREVGSDAAGNLTSSVQSDSSHSSPRSAGSKGSGDEHFDTVVCISDDLEGSDKDTAAEALGDSVAERVKETKRKRKTSSTLRSPMLIFKNEKRKRKKIEGEYF